MPADQQALKAPDPRMRVRLAGVAPFLRTLKGRTSCCFSRMPWTHVPTDGPSPGPGENGGESLSDEDPAVAPAAPQENMPAHLPVQEAVAALVISQASGDDGERAAAEDFAVRALEACRRYTTETTRMARRHEAFQEEFGETMISSWAEEQLDGSS